ncbi:MAG: hypothetical protein EA385_10710, partial [Salinarimonadaceae bacterium]
MTMISRRAMLRLAASSAALGLAGCFGTDGGAGPGDDPRGSIVGEPELLVATTRRPARSFEASPFFGPERGAGLSFARARMAPPSTGLASRVVTSRWSVGSVTDFAERDAAAAFARASLGKDVLLY